MTLCTACNLPIPKEPGKISTRHAQPAGCLDAQQKAMRALLHQIGEPDKCRGCEAPILWVRHLNGRKTPYTPAGLNHFVDCPQSERFGSKAGK